MWYSQVVIATGKVNKGKGGFYGDGELGISEDDWDRWCLNNDLSSSLCSGVNVL